MINPLSKLISLILCFFVVNLAPLFSDNAETETVCRNVSDGLINGTVGMFSGPDIYDPDDIMSRLAEDENGNLYFGDINYADPDRTAWPASRHLKRTEQLAILYRRENDGEKKEKYKAAVIGLLDHWIKADYQNSNWWYNKLSNPNILGEIGILMKDDLDKDRLIKLSALVGRGSFTVSPLLYSYTGANAVDLSMSTIKFGALTGSSRAVKIAARVVSDELKYSSSEGLKKDHTFFQHGNRLYMGGYGITFINAMTNVFSMLSGTDYIFTEKQLDAFAAFILDGLRLMSFGSTLDPSVMGRSVSRLYAQPLRSIVPELTKLAALEEMPRKDELKAYAASIISDTKNDYGLHYFDDAKFIVINNGDFYFSFRGGDSKLVYSEVINDENVLGYNSSVPGVTTLMHTGREYVDIAPVYDYSLVPGVTAVYENDEQLLAHGDFSYRTLRGTYCEASQPGAAVLGAKTTHEGINMTVACFATDSGAVLLGAGLKDSQNRKMFTALDQCFYAGSFTREDNVVVHNGIKYTVLDGGTLNAGVQHKTGDWHRNNLPLAQIPAEGDIFTVFIENDGSYAYVVSPEDGDADFEIIENSEKLQAVRLPDGRIAAVFYEKGSFDYNGISYSGKAGEGFIR